VENEDSHKLKDKDAKIKKKWKKVSNKINI
jgi:hypothetical protein